MHPRLIVASIKARREAREAERKQLEETRPARRLAGWGVCESIEAMTGRAPRPAKEAPRFWMALVMYLAALAAVCGVLTLAARHAAT